MRTQEISIVKCILSVFALNFYDKVEETLLKADRVEDCRKFNSLLKTFDPHKDKVSDLYLVDKFRLLL